MRPANRIIGLALLVMAQFVCAQDQNQLSIGENTKLSAGGLLTFGYSGDYGNDVPSSHGLNGGIDGKLSGYYYSPNFLSFTATPYYNQSRANSSFQSLTGASGVDGTANLFTGSHFPGSVNYHYDRNSSGVFGLAGQPNFTTVGKGQGFGINWSALFPNLPTLSVGYSQGAGSGTIYGTDQETSSNTRILNVHSGYQVAGFLLNAYYTRDNLKSAFPQFLAGQSESVQDSSANTVGAGAQHSLPFHGSGYANYNRTSSNTNYSSGAGQSSYTSNYVDDIENAGATFHPTQKLSFDISENYTSNLSGYLAQTLSTTGVAAPGINLGTGAHSTTVGGGTSYQFTNYLSGSAQATHYNQYFFGQSFTGTFMSGTVSYSKRLLDMFSFSASVVDSSTGLGNNSVGFVGNVNFSHRFLGWNTSAVFSYAQNVQSILITYTTSSYNYSANVRRRLPHNLLWTTAFSGMHSGLTNLQGTSSHAEGYSTSLGTRTITVNANYGKSEGISLLGAGGLVPVAGTPGINEFILFNGSNYGGGFSVSPFSRLVFSGNFSRAISSTIGQSIPSHNNTEVYNAQLQYHVRRIGFQAGYTRFTQGISAVGTPATSSAYFAGITRWFDFF